MADNPIEAGKIAYKSFEDVSPQEFQVVGPDAEVNEVRLSVEQQEEAIPPTFQRERDVGEVRR